MQWSFFCGNNQRIKTVGYNRRRAPLRMFDKILNATRLNNSLHLHQKMVIPRMFPNIPRNISGHSPEWWTTFPEMFGNILRKITFPSFPASPAFRSLFLYSCIHSLQKLKNSFGKHFFKRNRLTRHWLICFNCVIKKKLFVKMKNVYCTELQKSIYNQVINTRKQSFTDVLQNKCS